MRAFLSGILAVVLLFLLQISTTAQNPGDLHCTASNVAVLECDAHQNLSPFYRYCHPCSENDATCAEGYCSFQNDPNKPRCCHLMMQSSSEAPAPQFVYELTLSNQGPKTIRAIEWEYIFIDRDTRAEVARHQFLSEQKISPRKRKKLVEYSISPPTRVISVAQLSQQEGERFAEKVVIRRVMYEDGSVWEPKLLPQKGREH